MTHPHTLGAPEYRNEFAPEAQPQLVEGRHPFSVEKGCIEQGPHSTIQGEVINRLPGNRLAIRCNGKIYQGRAVK